jgi:hypothetical protein
MGAQTEIAPLTKPERMALKDCEARIARNLEGFYEVGAALLEIKEYELFKPYKSFTAYLAERWEFTSQRACQLIGSSAVVDNLKAVTIVTTLPSNEGQARELIDLKPSEQSEVWSAVIEEAPTDAKGKPKITAKLVKEVRENWESGRSNDSGGADAQDDSEGAAESDNTPTDETPAGGATKCPNCGHDKFDEDGDCEKCHEPDVADADPGEDTDVKPTDPGDPATVLKCDIRDVVERWVDSVEGANLMLAAAVLDNCATELREAL